jgi:hypothetical protein
VIAKINPFFIIFTDISPYFEAENVPLFGKNLIQACSPLGHLSGGGGHALMIEWYKLAMPIITAGYTDTHV